MIRCCSFLWALAIGLLAQSAWAENESRLALLIGNASYKSSPLANPVNDVRLMEGALKDAGFTVLKAENASIREMRRLVRDFGDRLKASGGVGLFYFAGHGVQVRGENFLVSTDSDIRNEDEVADDSVNANVILEKMQSAGNRMNLIILDACRNNPFAVKSRSAVSGLATLSAPSGSLVAYSTAPGSVASDGSGKNGLYTQHLAKLIRQPGLSVEEVFKQVRTAVRKDSRNQQTPWENTALEGQFFFKEPVEAAAPAPASAAVAPRPGATDPVLQELAWWDSVKAATTAGELQAYLNRYPNGFFVELARARIAALGSGAKVKVDAVKVPATKVAAAPPAPTQDVPPAADVIGTLVTTDSLSGVKSSQDVKVLESDSEKTVYSTGDVIGKDGKVLQVRVGAVVLRAVSGALWTLPLQAGTSGSARIQRMDTDFDGQGTVDWKAVAAADGKVQINAQVGYDVNNARTYPAYGVWVATYSGQHPLPESFAVRITGGSSNAQRQTASAALTWR